MDKDVMVSVPMERYTQLLEIESKFMVLQKIINENRKAGSSAKIIIREVMTDES